MAPKSKAIKSAAMAKSKGCSSTTVKLKKVAFSKKPITWDARQTTSYGKFIEHIRFLLGIKIIKVKHKGHTYTFYQLPEEDENDLLLDIKLLVNAETYILVRIRKSNLYIVGYANKCGQWFVFEDQDLQFPKEEQKNITILPFGGSYAKLGELEELSTLGNMQLVDSIYNLAKFTPPIKNTKYTDTYKSHLRTLIVMVAESARFRNIELDLVLYDLLRYPDLFKTWGHLSQLIVDSQGVDNAPKIKFPNWSFKKLERNMGILNNCSMSLKALKASKKIKKSRRQ